MKTRRCSVCGEKIPKGRLEILPDATTCVKHSTEKPKLEKDLDCLDGPDAEDLRDTYQQNYN